MGLACRLTGEAPGGDDGAEAAAFSAAGAVAVAAYLTPQSKFCGALDDGGVRRLLDAYAGGPAREAPEAPATPTPLLLHSVKLKAEELEAASPFRLLEPELRREAKSPLMLLPFCQLDEEDDPRAAAPKVAEPEPLSPRLGSRVSWSAPRGPAAAGARCASPKTPNTPHQAEAWARGPRLRPPALDTSSGAVAPPPPEYSACNTPTLTPRTSEFFRSPKVGPSAERRSQTIWEVRPFSEEVVIDEAATPTTPPAAASRKALAAKLAASTASTEDGGGSPPRRSSSRSPMKICTSRTRSPPPPPSGASSRRSSRGSREFDKSPIGTNGFGSPAERSPKSGYSSPPRSQRRPSDGEIPDPFGDREEGRWVKNLLQAELESYQMSGRKTEVPSPSTLDKVLGCQSVRDLRQTSAGKALFKGVDDPPPPPSATAAALAAVVALAAAPPPRGPPPPTKAISPTNLPPTSAREQRRGGGGFFPGDDGEEVATPKLTTPPGGLRRSLKPRSDGSTPEERRVSREAELAGERAAALGLRSGRASCPDFSFRREASPARVSGAKRAGATALAPAAFARSLSARGPRAVLESITGRRPPGISSNPTTSPKSNSFSVILEPLILASRVLDD